MTSLGLLLLGLVGLWLGTGWAVASAVRIAERFALSHMFIGLTILAVGTDLPELVVAVSATIDKLAGIETSGIILGNAIGSAVTQITVVLGAAGLVGFLALGHRQILADGLSALGAVALLGTLSLDGSLTRLEGAGLLVGYGIYYLAVFRREGVVRKVRAVNVAVPWGDAVRLLAGLAVVVLASETVVNSAIRLAEAWEVEQSLIAIVIIAVGTSLPELAISLRAVLRKNAALSVGNLLGSNIFDLLVPVGVAASASGLSTERELIRFDLPYLFVVSLAALVFFAWKKGLQKKEALLLLGAYVLYVAIKTSGALPQWS